METNLAISVSHLVKRYPKADKNAVDDIDLSVKRGEIYGFLGPNGAGKSTAIGVFVTSLFPTSGDTFVNGIDVTKGPSEIRRHIGVVYQKNSLDEKLTVEENLRSHAVLYDLAPWAPTYSLMNDVYKKRLDAVLSLVELPETRNQVVKSLSGGMQRRIDIARALLHIPKILFLDEPTTGLDPQSRRAVWKYIQELQKDKNFTIFLTTQYLEEAEICSRISIIDHGKILVTDTPANLKKSIGSEALYLTAENPEKLEKELVKKKIQFRRESSGEFSIELHDRRAQHVLAEITSELVEINIKQPSLDDVFIQMTGRKMDQV